MPDLTYADVEERLLRELGSRRRELGEQSFEVANSRWHQRAAQHEVAHYDWTAWATRFVDADTDLTGEARAHAIYVLAGRYRERTEQGIAETEVEFLATREAGQR